MSGQKSNRRDSVQGSNKKELKINRFQFDMINEKEEDELFFQKQQLKETKQVAKKPFLSRGSGKAGGVGNPQNQLAITKKSKSAVNTMNPVNQVVTSK